MHEYYAALKLEPGSTKAANDLAWLLATTQYKQVKNATEAVRLAEMAAENTSRKDPAVLDTLAVAYAVANQFVPAIEVARLALKLAEEQEKESLAAQLGAELKPLELGRSD